MTNLGHRRASIDAGVRVSPRRITIGQTSSTAGLADTELPERYKLLRHIADGGMASVWCAHDSVLARKVAIKILAPRFRHDPWSIRRFEREARAAARLSGHRNIVTIYDVGSIFTDFSSDEQTAFSPAFIVMEYLAGGTVADTLRLGRAPLDQARRWIHDAAAALDYAHRLGVVHCDIKPPNLLLDNQRTVHIADFGIATIASGEEITGTGKLFGTAPYASPEQALGGPATDASDRYALAVVAYELLVGERPFEAGSVTDLGRRQLDQDAPAASKRNPDLPRTLDPILKRGMAKRPEDRWPTAAAFAAAIDVAVSQRRVAFAPPAAPAPTGRARATERAGHSVRSSLARRIPRRPHAGALAALAAAALLTGLAVGLSQRGNAARHVHAAAPVENTPLLAFTPIKLPVHHRKPQPAAQKPAPQPAPQPPSQPASQPPPTAPAPPSGATLEAQGHSLLLAGNYQAALGVLGEALHTAAPGSVIYQWALYDLGDTYLKMGDVGAAIPLLQQRLRYPVSRTIVQQTLGAARSEQRGQTAPAPGRSKPKPSKQPKPGRHRGRSRRFSARGAVV